MAEKNRIDLNYGYYVEVDPLCYTLKFSGKTKKGEERKCDAVCGYFNRMDQVLEKYIYLSHIDRNSPEAVSLMQYEESIRNHVKNALRGLQKELVVFPVK